MYNDRPWNRLRRGAKLQISIILTGLMENIYHYKFICCNNRALSLPDLISSDILFVYGDVLFGLDSSSYGVFVGICTRIKRVKCGNKYQLIWLIVLTAIDTSYFG